MLFDTGFTIPQVPADISSETVFLIQYSTWGHHSLAFYRQNQLIEFTYGDWAMFALNKRDLFTAITHMAFPTTGALGRKIINWSPEQPAVPMFTDCLQIVPFLSDHKKAET
jgi:hypothetical protein